MIAEADLDLAGSISQPGSPDWRGPAAGGGGRAGQDRGGPVRGGRKAAACAVITRNLMPSATENDYMPTYSYTNGQSENARSWRRQG